MMFSCFWSYKSLKIDQATRHFLFSETKVERKWCTNSKMHRGGWGLETRLQNADTWVSKEANYRGLDGEATECRLCKHCGCLLNTVWGMFILRCVLRFVTMVRIFCQVLVIYQTVRFSSVRCLSRPKLSCILFLHEHDPLNSSPVLSLSAEPAFPERLSTLLLASKKSLYRQVQAQTQTSFE